MKLSDLKKIIREEILKEYQSYRISSTLDNIRNRPTRSAELGAMMKKDTFFGKWLNDHMDKVRATKGDFIKLKMLIDSVLLDPNNPVKVSDRYYKDLITALENAKPVQMKVGVLSANDQRLQIINSQLLGALGLSAPKTTYINPDVYKKKFR